LRSPTMGTVMPAETTRRIAPVMNILLVDDEAELATPLARILEREGTRALTTTRIAEVAGVSIGSVYRYFPHKQAIVAAIYDSLTEEERQRISDGERIVEGLSRLPVAEMVRRIVSVPLEAHRHKVALHDDFYRSYHQLYRWSTRLGSELTTGWIRRALEAHRSQLRVRDLDAAAFLFSRGVSAVLHAVVEERPEALEDDEFVESLVDLWTRFLVEEGAARASDTVPSRSQT